MKKRGRKRKSKIVKLDSLKQINLNAAGLDIGAAYYQEKYKQRAIRNLKRKAHQLGLEVMTAAG